jgi:putative ABC transport system permease protein
MSNGLAQSSVRFRPASFAGTCVALVFAATVVTACGTLLQTGVTARVEPVRYADVPVVVAADQYARITVGSGEDADEESSPLPERARVDAGMVDRIARQPGVAAAIADPSVPVQAASLPSLTGRDWSATAIAAQPAGHTGSRNDPLVEGRAPAADEVVLDATTAGAAGLGVDDVVRLTAPTGTATYRITGLAHRQVGEATAWFDDGTTARLAGHPEEADAIAVLPSAGVTTERLVAQVQRAIGDGDGGRVRVYTGDRRGELEAPQLVEAREMLVGIGASFGGVATATAVFVVMGTVSLAVGQRGHEIALLRAAGATPRQIRRMVATEAMLVAPLASVLGAVPGVMLARWWFDQLVERNAVPPGVELSTGVIPIAAAVGAGLLAALTAGHLAARRPSNASPSRALGETAIERRRPGIVRSLLGVVALTGALVLAALASTLTGDDAAITALGVVFLFLLAVGLLGPIVAWLAATVLGLPLRAMGSTPAALAAANTRAEARRLASAITPIVMVIAFCGTLIFLQTTTQHTSHRHVDEGVIADHVVSTRGAGLPAGLDQEAAALPGVDAAVGVLRTDVLYRAHGVLTEASALGVSSDPAALEKVLDLDIEEGSLADLAPPGSPGDADGVALDRLIADSADLSLGDRIDLRLGDGARAEPRVVAIYGRGLGLGGMVMPRAAIAGHVDASYDDQVLVADANGVDRATVARELAQLDAPGVVVLDQTGYAAQVNEDAELNAWANYVMAAVLGGFATVAAVNTLVMVMLDRRREVSLLRLAGMTRRQVLRMVRWEALVVAGSGLVIGASIALLTLRPLARGVADSSPYVATGPAVAIAGGAVLLGLLSTSLPARALLSRR